ncbi:MAG TPA: TonB-dependent receptor plug domain-containing protein, partial [Chitinophagaceae bacterium]|nr:TonB-dependent receptor plug domain-containing protein [Chitinophagaceae bacterium]
MKKISVLSKVYQLGKLLLFYSFLFCFPFLCSFQSDAKSPLQTISLSYKNTPLAPIFKDIRKQSGFLFIYNDDQLDKAKNVSIEVKNGSLEYVLDLCFKDQPLSYKIVDYTVVVVPKILSEISFSKVISDPVEINGVITDEAGNPLANVSIVLKGTQKGTTSDDNGKFVLDVSGGGTLVFSHTGFSKYEVVLKNQKFINLKLQRQDASLDQVVVVGYGTQLKREVSGAISVIKEKDFNKGVTQTAADLLQGKVAGLTITTETGDVTARQTIRLRGTSSLTGSSTPFVVIDGVPGLDLNSVSPQDIESISVLKDAAATAIYGSRSASGVILITTKKGKPGQQHLQFNNYIAFDKVANKPNLLSADEWRKYTKDSGLDVTGLDAGANTDWFDEIMRTGISNNSNISISGGSDKGNYRASINYLKRQGIMKDNDLSRYNVLFSVN